MGFDVTAPGAWQVFLSSTDRDFERYRRAVHDALQSRAQIACFSSGEWAGGHDDTVAKCKAMLQGSHGFVLLLGHWYGSIPPRSRRSITHLEYQWARERWKRLQYPPLAVMVPRPDSRADKELRAHAQRLIDEDEVDVAVHTQQLHDFHEEARRSWRICKQFGNVHELREHVIVTCLGWKGETALAAARGQLEAKPTIASQVSEEQLGRLGRKAHFDAVDTALAAVEDAPDVPALAFLLSGHEDAGQRAFARRLAEAALKGHGPRARHGSLPFQSADIAALVAWVAQALGLRGVAVQTPEALAEHVAAELKCQPLQFSLHRIALLPGGVAMFQRQFWLPFHAKLRELRRLQQFRHRLVALIVDYSESATDVGVAQNISPNEAPDDFTRLLQLPRLNGFNRTDVIAWLRELDVPDEPAGRRADIATRVLQNDRRENDFVPRRVFERLAGEELWPDEESI